MGAKVDAILQATSGAVGVLEGWGGMFLLELIRSGISGVMPGQGVSDILGKVFRLAKSGEFDSAYQIFQGVLPQIVFCLQTMELYHHAEKMLLEARGILPGPTVREATCKLNGYAENHIRFLNDKILLLLGQIGLPRTPSATVGSIG